MSGSDEVYKAYTGIANVPSITADGTHKVTAHYYIKSGSIVTMMYIDATNAKSVSTSLQGCDLPGWQVHLWPDH